MNAAPAGDVTNWADVWAMSIAVTSIGITMLSVLVAFFLSRNYLQSIKEMEEIRKSSADLADQVKAMSNFNSSLLRESMLAVRTIFDLMMLAERRRDFESLRYNLETTGQWKGRSVSPKERESYSVRLQGELDRVNSAIAARQTELYWLVGQSTERAAHLHALSTTRGDDRTIDLLDSIRATRADPEERDELLAAATALRQRLGKPAWVRHIKIDTRRWTGLKS